MTWVLYQMGMMFSDVQLQCAVAWYCSAWHSWVVLVAVAAVGEWQVVTVTSKDMAFFYG